MKKTAYVEVATRGNKMIVDGYSAAKTLVGVCHDVARILEKYNVPEASSLAEVRTRENTEEFLLSSKDSCGGYYFEVEEVDCASCYNDEDEIEYKDGYNFYFCICVFV